MLFVLTLWLLTHVLFLWMVAVSLWLSRATGQHGFQSLKYKERKEKRKSLYGGVEQDNNIVNQMWLRLLLHSKP